MPLLNIKASFVPEVSSPALNSPSKVTVAAAAPTQQAASAKAAVPELPTATLMAPRGAALALQGQLMPAGPSQPPPPPVPEPPVIAMRTGRGALPELASPAAPPPPTTNNAPPLRTMINLSAPIPELAAPTVKDAKPFIPAPVQTVQTRTVVPEVATPSQPAPTLTRASLPGDKPAVPEVGGPQKPTAGVSMKAPALMNDAPPPKQSSPTLPAQARPAAATETKTSGPPPAAKVDPPTVGAMQAPSSSGAVLGMVALGAAAFFLLRR